MRVIVVMAIVLLAAAGVVIGLFPHGFIHAIGIDTQASDEYAFFSGFGAWLSATLGLTTIVLAFCHHLNCHAGQCLRIGRFPVAGGAYKVCRKHWGEVNGHQGALTIRYLREHHHLHAGGQPGTIPDDPGPGQPGNRTTADGDGRS